MCAAPLPSLQTATGLTTQEFDEKMGVLLEQKPKWTEVYRNFTQHRERYGRGRGGEGVADKSIQWSCSALCWVSWALYYVQYCICYCCNSGNRMSV